MVAYKVVRELLGRDGSMSAAFEDFAAGYVWWYCMQSRYRPVEIGISVGELGDRGFSTCGGDS